MIEAAMRCDGVEAVASEEGVGEGGRVPVI
jgi:hypothetical protein